LERNTNNCYYAGLKLGKNASAERLDLRKRGYLAWARAVRVKSFLIRARFHICVLALLPPKKLHEIGK